MVERLQPRRSSSPTITIVASTPYFLQLESLTGEGFISSTPYRSHVGLFDTWLIVTRALALPCYCARGRWSLNILLLLLLSSWQLRDFRDFPFRRNVGFSASIGALVNTGSDSTPLLQVFPHPLSNSWLVTSSSAHLRVDHCIRIRLWWLRSLRGLFSGPTRCIGGRRHGRARGPICMKRN